MQKLAAVAGCDRRTLWQHWRGVADGSDLRLQDVLHWFLLLRAATLKTPSRSWATVADELGMHAQTLGRISQQLSGLTLREVAVQRQGELVQRFERDVLGRAGVSHAVVMIGVNDLGGLHRNKPDDPAARARMLDDLRLAHRQLVERAHARGVCVIGGTITPYSGSDYYKPAPVNEADRRQLNDWIRSAGVFDGVADFDAALRDPAQPELLRKEYDKGDGLHPSPAGMRALADAVPVAALRKCAYAPGSAR